MPKKIDLSELFGNPIKQDDRLYSRPVAQLHEFYLSGEIDSPENYIEWFQTIRHASENDIIKIYINSPGGDVYTAIQFIRALQETNASAVIASVEGICASAATMILLQADSYEVSEHSSFMIHNYNGGTIGKGHEMHAQAQYERGWSVKLIEEIYDGFLTKAEMQKVIDGADLWMDGVEVVKRLKKKAAKQKKEETNAKTDSNTENGENTK
jgi:ATP-dependent protease ClpP protease subunit